MAPNPSDVGRYLRTVAQLRPEQLMHRVRLRAQRSLTQRWPVALAERWRIRPSGPVGLPGDFRAIDSILLASRWDLGDLATGTFTFLNERRALGSPVQWDPSDASQLWLFNHHYWEWAWTLAAAPDRDTARAVFAAQWTSWREQTRFGRWNAWAAYPVSLRVWVLVNVFPILVAGTDLEETVIADLGLHAGFLEHNLELDVGGNHLIKNIKALAGLAIFLGDERLLGVARHHLVHQIAVQVLPDGGNYELTPSYHCQVLGDFIDVATLLRLARQPAVPELDDAIARMRTWLGLMRMPDGGVPLFNDCEPVGPEQMDLLEPGPPPSEALSVLPDTGYVVVQSGPFHLIADVGQPGPADLPGHIHADCLSFELAVNGRRVIVDPGTSEYGSGPRRQYERSTRAHNTVEIDGVDQTEVWGAFRAGRRAVATFERAETVGGTVIVTASHDGYRHLEGRPIHRRTWTVTPESLRITDAITGTGRHDIVSRLTFPAGATDQTVAGAVPGEVLPGAVTIADIALDGPRRDTSAAGRATVDPSPAPRWARTTHAQGFGVLEPAVTCELALRAELPIDLTSTVFARTRHHPTEADAEKSPIARPDG